MKFDLNEIKKGINYIKHQGVSGIWSNIKYKVSGPGLAYNGWYKEHHEADEEELALQRETYFDYEPLISIIVPVYMTPEFFLRSMIESVMKQTYSNWQLVLVDGSRAVDDGNEDKVSAYERLHSIETEKVIRQYMEEDSRIEYRLMEENLGIAENSNVAIAMARGEYIAMLSHDDMITEDALFAIVKELQEQPYEFLYADVDKMSEDGTKYTAPAFKPDFSPDLLRSYNYIKHFPIVKASLARAVGGYHREYEGGQDYDFILRCCENVETPANIKHIPRVLYHWRKNNRSAGITPKKENINAMSKKALSAHLERMKVYATASHTDTLGLYKVVYETPGNPLLSIIVSAVSSIEHMEKLLKSLFERTRYSNFEVLIIDDQTDDGDRLSFYRSMEAQRKNIHVVTNGSLDSISAKRNYGASIAKGEYLFFLDSNLEMMTPTTLGDMLGVCIQERTGAVSGTIYNDNNTVHHKGIVLGVNGVATYLHQGVRKGDTSYMMLNRANTNHSAVSGCCMMVKKVLYDKVGGFSDKFRTNLTDIDFCLKLRELNYYVTAVADANWCYHSVKNTPADTAIRIDTNLFEILWSNILTNGDPFYNPNFTKEGNIFAL